MWWSGHRVTPRNNKEPVSYHVAGWINKYIIWQKSKRLTDGSAVYYWLSWELEFGIVKRLY